MSQEAIPREETAAGASKRRLLSPADNPLVRAVGRVPAGVHVKLLVAFVGTALLVVVLGVLGLRLIGQSNERVETLGTLQVRAFAYGKLRSDAGNIRGLLAQRVGGDYFWVWQLPDQSKEDLEAGGWAIDRALLSAATLLPPSTRSDQLGFQPPPEDEGDLARIRETWVFTVASERCSTAAISAFDSPPAARSRISRSRGVSWSYSGPG